MTAYTACRDTDILSQHLYFLQRYRHYVSTLILLAEIQTLCLNTYTSCRDTDILSQHLYFLQRYRHYVSTLILLAEIQTYYLNINLTEEIGCETNKSDKPFCYIYQPIRLRKQYLNPNTGYYIGFRNRIRISGVSVQ